MTTFGPRLKERREERGLTRAKVAETTGIYIHDIAAVEFEAYDALPPDAEVEDLLRRYGAFLELDGENLVDSFRRERPGRPVPPPPEPEPEPASDPVEDEVPRSEEMVVGPAPPPEVVEEPPPVEKPPTVVEEPPPVEKPPTVVEPAARPEPKRVLPVALGTLAVVVVAGVLWWMLSGEPSATDDTGQEPGAAPVAERTNDPRATMPAPADRHEPSEASTVESQAAEPAPAPAPVEATGSPRIREHGVGTDVVDHLLVGKSDRFPTGTQVWFWTRVEGGEPGSRVVHVWLHDGREVDRISLRVGSRNWRTQSAKRIYEPGRWTVEARTEDGRVLARDELTAETR